MRTSRNDLSILISLFSRPSSYLRSRNGLAAMISKQYHQSKSTKRQKTASETAKNGSNEEILLVDVKSLLSRSRPSRQIDKEGTEDGEKSTPSPNYSPPERFSEIEVRIAELSSTGDGLGVSSTSDHVYVVPFTAPGDLVQAKVVNYFPQAQYTLTDFISVIKPAPQRDDTLIKCPYFAKCAGCQLQMMPYEAHLQHKKTIVEKAFRNYSSLTPEAVPAVGDTIGSPLQYGYRTKLTPHFDGPPGSMNRKAKRDSTQRKGFIEVPPIGFMLKGTRKTIDIEDCPIGTDAVRKGIKVERKKIAEEISKYTRGATILLRETTVRKPKQNAETVTPSSASSEVHDEKAPRNNGTPPISTNETTLVKEQSEIDGVPENSSPYVEDKTYITDQRAISTEYVDDFEFKNTAGAFFQNNNSILPIFTAYIRDHILRAPNNSETQPIKYLIDAYCGSGLFTITLSSLFSASTGIDIASASIVSAKENATANRISNTAFMTADASKLFQEVQYPPEETAVIIDPPRKGCDDAFLQQLMKFGPQRVVYVSCNVHTQARDIGVLVEGNGDFKYEIESLQGFDFFPQTGHVEGVAVLARSRRSGSLPS